MSDDVKPVPQRPDGSNKRFWYDPDMPGHILHLKADGTVEAICVGHHE